jgi:glycosyltransferase involved in cell wall biosynthesis
LTSPRLRIGIDCTSLGAGRGYGRFLGEMLPDLLRDADHDWVLFVDPQTREHVAGLPGTVVCAETQEGQAEGASARGSRGLGSMWQMGRTVARTPLDVFWFPSVYTYYPIPSRVPILLGILDTIPERHGDIVFPTTRTRLFWNAKSALARRQARAILTISEWSKTGISDWFRIPRDDIHIAIPAPSPAFGPTPETAPRDTWLSEHGLAPDARYLIYVGGFNPHKNLVTLADAFTAFHREHEDDDLRLIMVGDYAGDLFYGDVSGLRERLEQGGVLDRVCFPGFVPDAELRHLYCGALATVLPSFEEGLGLCSVEGAACGTPCIATTQSPLPKLLKGAGLFVDPEDTAGLTQAISTMARDTEKRAAFAANAQPRASRLTWQGAADATVHALESVAQA